MIKKLLPVSLIISIMMWLVPTVSNASEDWNPTLYGNWGNEASTLIEQDFRKRGTDGYYEDQNKQASAYCWPNSINILALAGAAKMNPNMYTDRLAHYITQMDSHWTFKNNKHGYDAVADPAITNRFYDDNAWMSWALTESYMADNNPAHLQRAEDTYAFTISGEDTVQGGGIYWKETQYLEDPARMKAISSTAGAALTAALLYSITDKAAYKDDSVRLLTWIWDTLREPDSGLIGNSVDINGVKDWTKWAYDTGVPMYAYAVLYSKTKESIYLDRALSLANAAEKYFVSPSTGAIKDGSYFAFTLLEGWLELYKLTGDAHWRDLAGRTLQFVHDHRDVNGRYPERWDETPTSTPIGEYLLLRTAPAARAYWRAAEIDNMPLRLQSFIPSKDITIYASSAWPNLSPTNTSNDSGLLGYLHDNNKFALTMWHTLAGGTGSSNPYPGTVTGAAWVQYSWEQSYKLGRVWIWNYNQLNGTAKGLRKVTIQYTNDGNNWLTLGNYELAEAAGAASYPHNIEIDFGGISAKSVMITANTADGKWGNAEPYYGLSEVRFGINDSIAVNLAPSAAVTASSQYNSDYAAAKAVDGIYGLHGIGEWASLGELNPWIQLAWDSSKMISKVVLMDRINLADAVRGGTLTFSDGSSITVSDIANDGTPKIVTFLPKNVTWVKFQASAGTGANVGLSEMQVY